MSSPRRAAKLRWMKMKLSWKKDSIRTRAKHEPRAHHKFASQPIAPHCDGCASANQDRVTAASILSSISAGER